MSGDQHRQTRKVLMDLLTTLTEEGASAVKLVDITHIVVDERVRLKCQIPLCDSFNKNLMCPPYVPSVDAFRVALALFSKAILIQVSGWHTGVDGFGGHRRRAALHCD